MQQPARLALAVALVLFSSGLGRAGTPAQVCAGSKLKATGKAAGLRLGCHSAAAKRGAVADGGCLAKADTVLTHAFVTAEARGGCATTGDVGAVDAILDSAVSAFVTQLRPAMTANRCASIKLKATGRKARAKCACHGRAVRRGVGVDPGCLAKAEAHFATVFAAADGNPTCFTTNDAGTVEHRVDDLVGAVVATIPTASTTTTTSSTTTSTTLAAVCGNGIREGAEQCDTTPDLICESGGRSGCIPAGGPDSCKCCTMPGETGFISLGGDVLNQCCDLAAPQPVAAGVYFCPNTAATCFVSAFPTCGGTCDGGTTCVPVIFGGSTFCSCLPPGPCDGTCSGAQCPAGEACNGATCSCELL